MPRLLMVSLLFGVGALSIVAGILYGCSNQGVSGWYGIDVIQYDQRLVRCDVRGTIVQLGCEAERELPAGVSIAYRLPPGEIRGVDSAGRGVVKRIDEVR